MCKVYLISYILLVSFAFGKGRILTKNEYETSVKNIIDLVASSYNEAF